MKYLVAAALALSVSALALMAQEKNVSPALKELADSERAFARYSVEHNTRDAFIKFFADDGVNFAPQPSRTRETLSASPPAPSPPRSTLNWAPIYGDIASSGDLGITFGMIRANGPLPDGPSRPPVPFFTIWRRADSAKPWRYVAE